MYDIKNYITDENFKITITNKNIYIYNYGKIVDISDTLVTINTNNKKIKIYGKSIIIKKLDKREMLISGSFSKVEL